MPLVHPTEQREEPASEGRLQARKVRPQYLGGDLVKVGWAPNLAEAELLQGLLLEEGIPSVQRRTRGFDVPQFLAAGPRDLLVPAAAYEAARELLAGGEDDARAADGVEPGAAADGGDTGPLGGVASSASRLAIWVALAAGGAVAIVYALYELTG